MIVLFPPTRTKGPDAPGPHSRRSLQAVLLSVRAAGRTRKPGPCVALEWRFTMDHPQSTPLLGSFPDRARETRLEEVARRSPPCAGAAHAHRGPTCASS